jgi:glutamate dehydrogenase/leucine dehydrogenase
MSGHEQLRMLLANQAEKLMKGEISFDDFQISLPCGIENSEDEDISELMDLIVHEPAAGGVFGTAKETSEKYRKKIWMLIEKLLSV